MADLSSADGPLVFEGAVMTCRWWRVRCVEGLGSRFICHAAPAASLTHLPEEGVIPVASSVVAHHCGEIFGDLVSSDSLVQVHCTG